MDNKQLAEMLFPNVKLSTQEIEQNFPPRNLPPTAQVVRFAPSPTGFLHIGNFFTAFIDRLTASKSNGVFFFRLEDTDKKREVAGSELVALNMLKAYDILPDEGLMPNLTQIGNYGPYAQSQRTQIYLAYAKKLVANGKAYPCFCEKTDGKKEVIKKREQQLTQDGDIEEQDICRNLSYNQIEQNLKANLPFAIRLKSCGLPDQTIKFYDEIRGERELHVNCKDVILVKNNGTPPYTFAHPIDDHLMGTTLVIRGEDWFPSLPCHLEITKALGFAPPKYAHTPNLCMIGANDNKLKLSKRMGASDMRFFIKQGYPKTAILEYLLNLANSGFELWRKNNPQLCYKEFPFSINKIGKSSPIFDLVKLDDVSKTIISKMNTETAYNNLFEWAKDNDEFMFNKIKENSDFVKKIVNIGREISKPRKDIAKWKDFETVFAFMFHAPTVFEWDTKFKSDIIKNVLLAFLKTFCILDSNEIFFGKLKDICAPLGFSSDMKIFKANSEKFLGNIADIACIIRTAITGKQDSPDLYTIMQILGKIECENRTNFAYNSL
ncbi:MAG: glutamate--tRNA ligase family protein [Clostridia bacterium]